MEVRPKKRTSSQVKKEPQACIGYEPIYTGFLTVAAVLCGFHLCRISAAPVRTRAEVRKYHGSSERAVESDRGE